MRQFGWKEKKQKTLSLPFDSLLKRLNELQELKNNYIKSLSNKNDLEKQNDDLQTPNTKNNLIQNKIKYDAPILHIRDKQYDLSKSNFQQEIIKNLDKLNVEIDNQASHLVELRHMSSIEFYLLVSQYHLNENLHFSKSDICTICQFELFEIEDWEKFDKILTCEQLVVGLPCDHYYHMECLTHCIKEQHIQCPICGRIYGIKTGDQPDGEMIYHIEYNTHCESYEDQGTIVIYYNMYPGQRNGQNFPSTHRQAFLPDTPEGRQVFRLLKLAFERKLIFTVGRSVTTGKDNRIVWNGIHHKTSLMGGVSCFGYPDPTYFSRVKEELAAKGIY
ncbi:unnamed protein product (macronuclear) [Paramecium tetraurelia]|uniref:RING-type E3 ubiquitin transferase n=1 Tax=Paramecium tetraurelia TaxID=5888 RepID=A0DFW4_PARTE|nr:uncharacterized protein GSPATT00002059001 [Paramecium tetraurelia]CAK81931.1 unnamed protein product [Paramecium tetraurelia]|eukprot:XP_001449328.1 hypothetical protein (macronuclear) [Paramecium tetraurelia strain d4-2]